MVTGTIFPHRLTRKQTWTSPGGRTKNQIDHVLVSRQHRTSVMDTKAMRGHCERPPISALKNQAETKEKTKEQGDLKEILYN